MEFPSWLVPYQPLVPLKSLVTEVNGIYHSFDATKYDAEHTEIRVLWPGLWAEMMNNFHHEVVGAYWILVVEQVLRQNSFYGFSARVSISFSPTTHRKRCWLRAECALGMTLESSSMTSWIR